jgi:hypothetical protein
MNGQLNDRFQLDQSGRQKSFFVAMLLLLSVNAKAQIQWNIVQRIPKASPGITCLSCAGSVCTACWQTFDRDSGACRTVFWRTNNAGLTWTAQPLDIAIDSLPERPTISYLRGQFFSLDQIDSLHAIAVGVGGLILSTSNGGAKWIREKCPVTSVLTHVHCFSPHEGIITGVDSSCVLFKGEETWSLLPFKVNLFHPKDTIVHGWDFFMDGTASGQSYGNGAFKLICEGPFNEAAHCNQIFLYSTNNRWGTVDSSIIPFWRADSQWNEGAEVSWWSGDTIFIGGSPLLVHGNFFPYGILSRSFDAGKHWERLFDTNIHHGLRNLAMLSNNSLITSYYDTGYGATETNSVALQKVLRSTDFGSRWIEDTLTFNPAIDTGIEQSFDYRTTVTSDGYCIGGFNYQTGKYQSGWYGGSFLARVIPTTANVNIPLVDDQKMLVWPNPAITMITLSTDRTARITDIFGRTVLEGNALNIGRIDIDVSSLPSGVYYISDGKNRATFIKK